MKKYEHLIVTYDTIDFPIDVRPSYDEYAFLKYMGEKGWELVAVVNDEKWYFKREI